MTCSILGQAVPQQLAAASLADGPMTWMQVRAQQWQYDSLCFPYGLFCQVTLSGSWVLKVSHHADRREWGGGSEPPKLIVSL